MKRCMWMLAMALIVATLLPMDQAQAQKKKSKDDKKSKTKKGGTPEWITKPGLYEDVIVAAGIGEAMSEQAAKSEAETDARKKIAQVLQTQVQSLTTNFMEEANTTTETGSTGAAQEYFSEITQTMTDLTLKNVIIEEYYPPQGEKNGKKIKFYAKAVLSKTDFAEKFKNQVSTDAASGKINGIKMSANDALARLNKVLGGWGQEEEIGSTTDKPTATTGLGTGISKPGGTGETPTATAQTGSKAASYPDWKKSLPNRPSRPGYYQGLGVAPITSNQAQDEKDAESEARAQVIRAIRSEITSKVTSAMEERSSSSGGSSSGSYSESFNSVTESFSSESLKNLIVEFHTDKSSKKRYAYCEISIEEVNRQFAERLKKAINVAKTYYMAAKSSEANGDYYIALTQYLEGAKEVVIAEAINKEPIEGDIDGSGKSVSVRATFDTQLKQLLGRMRVEIVSGDAQKGTKNEPLAQPLVARLVYDNMGNVMSVKGAVLVSSSVAPTVVKADLSAQTDGSGNAGFTVHAVESVNASGVNKVRIGLSTADFEVFAAQLPGALEKAKTVFKDFSFLARGSSVSRIAILIFEENIGKPQSSSIIEGDIVKQLLASKYKVIDKNEVYRAISHEQAKASAESGDDAAANAIKSMADVLVIGYAKAMESVGGSTNPYGGGTSNRVSAWADCSIRVVDLETGKVLASSDIQREKGLSVGAAEKAGIIALQNLSKKASKEIVDNMNAALK